jgi:hypothetical protein
MLLQWKEPKRIVQNEIIFIAFWSRKRRILPWGSVALTMQLTSLTSGSHSVSIVRSETKYTEFSLLFIILLFLQ